MNRRDFIGGCAAGAVAAGLPAVPKCEYSCQYRCVGIGPTITQSFDMVFDCHLICINDGQHYITGSVSRKLMGMRGAENAISEELARIKAIWTANTGYHFAS